MFDITLVPDADWGVAGPDTIVQHELLTELRPEGERSCGPFSDRPVCTNERHMEESGAPYIDLVGMGRDGAEQVFTRLAGDAAKAPDQRSDCLCRARQEMEFKCFSPKAANLWIPFQKNQLQKSAIVENVLDANTRRGDLQNTRAACGADGLCEGDVGYPGAPDEGEYSVAAREIWDIFNNWPEL